MRARFWALLALAMPMLLARATQSVITFADAIQVKQLGPGAIAATSTGGLNAIAFVILPMGVVFIIQSFVAQLVGRGERDDAPRFAWYGLAIAAGAGVIAAAAIPAIPAAIGLTHYSPAVRGEMSEYVQIRLLSVAAAVGVEALGNWYGGLGNTWMQMIAGVITMVAAVAGNWLLIGGHLGAPAMGVNGAAVSSVIATWLGFGFLALAFGRGWGGAPRRHGPLHLTRRELGRVLRFGLPNGLNWFLEFAAFQLFVNGVVGGMGDVTAAALNVVLAVNTVAFMPAFGLASAGAILAAQAIGRGQRDDVWPTVKLTLAISIVWMCAVAGTYVSASDFVLGWFADEQHGPALIKVGRDMLAISALWQIFDATGMTFAETLRAAGDTAWTAGARIVLAWAVFVPASFYVVSSLGGGVVGAMACLAGYLALLAFAFALRFRAGAWRKIELIEPKLLV